MGNPAPTVQDTLPAQPIHTPARASSAAATATPSPKLQLQLQPQIPYHHRQNRRCLGWNELGPGRVRVGKRAVVRLRRVACPADGNIMLRCARDGRAEGWRYEVKLGVDLRISLGREIHCLRRVGRRDMVRCFVVPWCSGLRGCDSVSELVLNLDRTWNAVLFFWFLSAFSASGPIGLRLCLPELGINTGCVGIGVERDVVYSR